MWSDIQVKANKDKSKRTSYGSVWDARSIKRPQYNFVHMRSFSNLNHIELIVVVWCGCAHSKQQQQKVKIRQGNEWKAGSGAVCGGVGCFWGPHRLSVLCHHYRPSTASEAELEVLPQEFSAVTM